MNTHETQSGSSLQRLVSRVESANGTTDMEYMPFIKDVATLCVAMRGLTAAMEGCKWSDAGPLAWHKPEDEKYITGESLLVALLDEAANDKLSDSAGETI